MLKFSYDKGSSCIDRYAAFVPQKSFMTNAYNSILLHTIE